MYTDADFKVHLYPNRIIKVKLDLLNYEEFKIGELEGKLINGSYAIDRNSASRRMCNITFVLDSPNFIPNQNSYIWLNKKFRLFIGIQDIITNEFIWFNKGIFLMNKPELSLSDSASEITIQGLDKMCLYDGTLAGTFSHPYKLSNIESTEIIDEGLETEETIITYRTINDGIYGTLYAYGERKFKMDDFKINDEFVTMPYSIEKNAGDNVFNVIKELAELYMDWSEIFFDTDGFFVFEKNKERTNDPIIWNFDEVDFTLNYKNSPDFENIKNHIQIWGRLTDDKYQVMATLKNEDLENPYSIPNIGEKIFAYSNDKIFTDEQAVLRAEYELQKHSNLKETINLSCVPIYLLDVNNLIYINQPKIGIVGTYLINQVNCNLGPEGTMDITAYKIYN